MGKRLSVLVLGAALCVAAGARAQTIPEGQSCGGLLCDMGIIGHKTEPAATAPPAAVPAPVAPAPPPPAIKAAAAPVAAEPRRRMAQARKRIVARHPAATAQRVAAAPARQAPAAAARQSAAPVPPTPAVDAGSAAPRAPFVFQSIDPTLQ